MNRKTVLILGVCLLVPLAWSQDLDEINVVEMRWLIRCYQGIRPGSAAPPGASTSPYSQPAFLNALGRDENLAKERDLIKTTFNLADATLLSQGELWLRKAEPMGLITIVRENEKPLAVMLERLDTSWLHYRITAYETNAASEAVMRSAFTIPGSMTLRDGVVFGFEDSARRPFFLSLRIGDLYADGVTPGGAAAARTAGQAAGKPPDQPTITGPRLLSRVPPVYPEAAKKAGIEGTVILSVSLDEKGAVIRARVIKSVPELDQAALDAVRQWKYEPMKVDGKARPVVFTVPVEFKR
jgi:TonB family protein